MKFAEKTLNSEQVYDGKIVKVFKDDVELFNGKKSFREVVKHSGGVVVLAIKRDAKMHRGIEDKLFNDSSLSENSQQPQIDNDLFAYSPIRLSIDTNHLTIQPINLSTDNSYASKHPSIDVSVLFVRQFRYPIKEVLLELPAGKLEYGEDPFKAAKRELEEETGYCANKWTDLGYVYTSPGYSNEKLYLYLAEDLEYTKCHPDEGEILESLEIPLNEALEMIKSNKIVDAKTLCAFMRAIPLICQTSSDTFSHKGEKA